MKLVNLLSNIIEVDKRRYKIFIDDSLVTFQSKIVIVYKKDKYLFFAIQNNSDLKILNNTDLSAIEKVFDETKFPTDDMCNKIGFNEDKRRLYQVELSKYFENVSDYEIKVDEYSKLIFIRTPAYQFYNLVVRSKENQCFIFGENEVSLGDSFKIRNTIIDVAFTKYISSCELLFNILKRTTGLYYPLYFSLGSFKPILVSHSYLINPFLDSPTVYSLFEYSIFNDTNYTLNISSNDLSARCLTSIEICRALGINKYLEFSFSLMLMILGGMFVDSLPNTRILKYVPVNESSSICLNQIDYENLPSDKKYLFIEGNEMVVFCRKYFKNFKAQNPNQLYNVLKDIDVNTLDSNKDIKDRIIEKDTLLEDPAVIDYYKFKGIDRSNIWS